MLLYCFRGIANRDLTPETMAKLGGIAAAHFRAQGWGEISIAGDGRVSTSALKSALIGGLLGGGLAVHDCGVLPSGTIAAWGKHTALPSAMVTASHNPPEWNGVQFMEADSHIWWPELEDQAKALLDQPFAWPDWQQGGRLDRREDVLERYVEWVSELADPAGSLKVVLDPGGGVGHPAGQMLLERLGMETVVINAEPDGLSRARPSEPRAEYLDDLRRAVLEHQADLGLAFDGDADRLAVLDERGNYVQPDYLIELLCRSQVPPGPCVLNAGVSLLTMSALAKLGFEIAQCRWGQTFLAAKMKEIGAVFSAEPDGHFAFPALSLRGDGLAGGALLCSALTHDERPLSQIIAEMPAINIVNVRVEWDDDLLTYADEVHALMEREYAEVTREHDRLLIATDADRKLVVRQSPFDSTLRMSAESYGEVTVEQMLDQVRAIVLPQ